MRFQLFAAIAVLAAGTTMLAACGNDTTADEAAIRATNAKWQELIVAKDNRAIANLYAEEGQILPPNAPKAAGREAIEQVWTGLTAIPGLKLTFDTEKLVFARSGELAVETGTYSLTTGDGATQATETGKTVVTWIRNDGKWQVLTDMFSSNSAPAAPAPAPEATTPDAAATPADGTVPAEATPATGAAAPATPPAK